MSMKNQNGEKPGETSKFILCERVYLEGVVYSVVDIRRDGDGRWLYDLREVEGDGERIDVPESELARSVFPGHQLFGPSVTRGYLALVGTNKRMILFNGDKLEPLYGVGSVSLMIDSRESCLFSSRVEAFDAVVRMESKIKELYGELHTEIRSVTYRTEMWWN